MLAAGSQKPIPPTGPVVPTPTQVPAKTPDLHTIRKIFLKTEWLDDDAETARKAIAIQKHTCLQIVETAEAGCHSQVDARGIHRWRTGVAEQGRPSALDQGGRLDHTSQGAQASSGLSEVGARARRGAFSPQIAWRIARCVPSGRRVARTPPGSAGLCAQRATAPSYLLRCLRRSVLRELVVEAVHLRLQFFREALGKCELRVKGGERVVIGVGKTGGLGEFRKICANAGREAREILPGAGQVSAYPALLLCWACSWFNSNADAASLPSGEFPSRRCESSAPSWR